MQDKKDIVEKIAEPPISAVKNTVNLEKDGIDLIEKGVDKATDLPPAKQVKHFWHGLGPGLTTGAADDDPSGVATYSQQGAKFGFQLLWLSPFTFPLMAVVQEMCARIGLVTGRGLASNIRQYFPKWILYISATLLLIANSFNIGANLGGMAQATRLLMPEFSFWFLVIFFAFLTLFLQIFISYAKYARYLKYLALILLVYVISAFMIKGFPWTEILKHGFLPSLTFSKEQIILICGILGTTISPYLFFWETSQEVEEKIKEGKTTIEQRQVVDSKAIKKMRIDVWTGMFFSNLVMFFIVAVCASTLFPNGINNIGTAADAAAALKPLAGNYAYLLFSLGIIGTGLLSIPILAGSASYAVSESLGWKEGLYLKFKQAAYFYGVIIFSVLIGMIIHLVGIDSMKALIYAAVLNGIIAPIILILILLLSSNKKIMGERSNHPVASFFGWLVVGFMTIAAVATIFSII